MILARDPFCVICMKNPSTAVDHIVSKAAGGQDDPDNLRGICGPCHDAKTARDSQQAKSRKRLANTIRVGEPRPSRW